MPRDGTYKIYLQITYKSGGRVSFSLFKFAMDYKQDTLLLSCYDTVDFGEGIRKSLYTAATFDLKYNDRLKVKTSNPELMVLLEQTTFFGADLIS